MIKNLIGSLTILLILTACGNPNSGAPAQPGLETIVAGTLEALTPAAEDSPAPSFDGTAITINNLSFTIPTGLASGAQVERVEAIPAGGQNPFPTSAYDKYLIQGYVIPDRFHEPSIIVFPATEFAQVNEFAAQQISGLQTLLNSPSQPLPENLPFLPIFNAAQVFHSNESPLTFQSGNGIRFVTMYSQSPNPVNNLGLFYTYQGLTGDGKYYVAAILPISHPLITDSAETDTQPPAGGIPFDWSPGGYDAYPTYIDSVVQLLNSADPNSFTPALSSLDALIQSITITQ